MVNDFVSYVGKCSRSGLLMDLIAQIRITGFAAALFLCLMVQLPGVVSLRWWFYA